MRGLFAEPTPLPARDHSLLPWGEGARRRRADEGSFRGTNPSPPRAITAFSFGEKVPDGGRRMRGLFAEPTPHPARRLPKLGYGRTIFVGLVRISHHGGEGRGFSPAVTRPTH
jgi:hypothetical protein